MIYLIPARAGSKRLPGKNKRLFCGLPLWMWSLATANRLKTDDDVVIVSTDDPEIREQTLILGACYEPRPADLACDTATTHALVADVLSSYRHHTDTCVVLQPTSPDRSDHDVRAAIRHSQQADRSVYGSPTGNPLEFSGGVYVYRMSSWPTHDWTNAGYVKAVASDIDTIEDFEAAEAAFCQRIC